MPGGKLSCEFAAFCCALACTGCQTLWDASGHIASRVCAPAPYDEPADPELAARSPEVRELVSVAHKHHLNGEPELAATALLDALEFEPDNRRVRTILAITLALEGHIHAAELQFVEAMGIAEAHYNLGVIMFDHGDIKAAEQRFLRAVQHDASLQDARVWLDVARRELAEQTAKWHTEIHPLPAVPRQMLARVETPVPVVDLPQPLPMPIIEAAAAIDQSDSALPVITPVQLASGGSEDRASSSEKRVSEAKQDDDRPTDAVPMPESDASPAQQPVANSLPTEDDLDAPVVMASDERAELERLRAEVQRLKLEHEILTKAIGVIAADDVESRD